MNLRKLLFSTLLLSSTLLFSQSMIGLNVNDEDFELEGSVDITNIANYDNGTTYMVNANFISTNIEELATIGFSANNTFQGVDGLSIALGMDLVFLEDYWASPLLIKASYALPLIETIPTISLSGRFLYAPSVLSFDKAENYYEFRTEAGMEVISSVSIYMGYRNIEATYIDVSNKTFNDSFYGGLKIGF